MTDEEFKRVSEKMEQMVSIIRECVEAVTPAMRAILENIGRAYDVVLQIYPNRRVVHLAEYGHSERVRKKNRKRIQKWVEKGGTE